MTRDDAVSRLCDVYGGSFDITRCGEEELPLTAKMDFYVHNSKYVLSKKAKLWEANSFEYVYLFSVPHLTKEIYQQCELLAYEQGMARIQPGPNHMYTYISAIFLCDSCDPEARKALKRCHRYQSFRRSKECGSRWRPKWRRPTSRCSNTSATSRSPGAPSNCGASRRH